MPLETVFVSCYWWANSEPSSTLVALTEESAERMVGEAMLEEAHDAYAGDTPPFEFVSPRNALDSLSWSGVHQETLATLHLTAEELHELLEEGYIWLSR